MGGGGISSIFVSEIWAPPPPAPKIGANWMPHKNNVFLKPSICVLRT